MFLDSRLPMRFWDKVIPEPNSGCWLWLGSTNANGYGAHGRRAEHSGSQLTHRFTYETMRGALPVGAELDHRVCKTRSCCNPAHLEAVTHRENVLRGEVKRTHCKRGHELTGGNLMPTGQGSRCRECYLQHKARRCSEKREATRLRGPLPPRPKKTAGTCKRGHAKRFNGKRLICNECSRSAHHK